MAVSSPGLAPHANRSRAARRAGWWTVLVGVLLAHALMTLWLQANLVGWGDAHKASLQRFEVAFVQPLAPAAPPAARPPAARTVKRSRAPRPVPPAASAPSAEAIASAAIPASDAASDAAPEVIVAHAEPASAPEPASAAASDAIAADATSPQDPSAAFEWPPSTRLNYVLTGNYRGEVHGNARVQWVRQGARYQVHLDVAIGPSFAPLISRRMTSDGELGEQGLTPQRYDEVTKVAFQQPRRATIHFGADHVTLANGSQHPALPDLQDAASQFVQLTWLFTTQPALLRVGNAVTIALALPKRAGQWVYDVLGEERLATPVGELDTFHLKPRLGVRRPGNELSAEIWFAPTLQYLPVRIRIQQDADTYVDLMLDAAPLQASPDAPASAPR